MACQVKDYLVSFNRDNDRYPVAGQVIALPTEIPLFVADNGTFYPQHGPRIGRPDTATGSWELTLPWPSESDPQSTEWIIETPDGTKWKGTVPEGEAGPLSLFDLKSDWEWGLVDPQAQGAVQVATLMGVGPPGPRNDHTIETYATDFPGEDLGIQINAASEFLEEFGGGRIIVPHGDHSIKTQIVLTDNIHLILGRGLYDNEVPAPYATILTGNNTIIQGHGRATQIRHSKYAHQFNNITGFTVIEPKYYSVTYDYAGSDTLILRDFSLVPHPDAFGTSSAARAGIALDNSLNVLCENLYFDQTQAFAISVGGTSVTGKFAHGIKITKCTFDRTDYEAIAVVNADDCQIYDNSFYAADWASAIDFEPNEPTDVLTNLIVCNNLFDHRNPAFVATGGCVQIYGGFTFTGNLRIFNNIMLGGDIWGLTSFQGTSAVNIFGANDIEIANNLIVGFTSGGIIVGHHVGVNDYAERVTVRGNTLNSVGVNPSIWLARAVNCEVAENHIIAISPTGGSACSIVESAGFSDNNMIHGNRLRTEHANLSAPVIAVTGANSREWDNTIQGSRTSLSTDEQTVTAAATIAISPFGGKLVRIELSSTAITAVTADTNYGAPRPGQVMITAICQDNAGGKSISGWSSDFVFASSYTVTQDANARDFIVWLYDGTDAKWYEIARVPFAGGGGDLPSLEWRVAEKGKEQSAAFSAGNFSVGIAFEVTDQATVTGVRFYYPDTTSRTIKAVLWDPSQANVATGTATYSTAGYKTLSFTTPYSLTNVYKTFHVTLYETGGTSNLQISNVGVVLPTLPSVIGPSILYVSLSKYGAGDSFPSSLHPSLFFPVDPVFTVP